MNAEIEAQIHAHTVFPTLPGSIQFCALSLFRILTYLHICVQVCKP